MLEWYLPDRAPNPTTHCGPNSSRLARFLGRSRPPTDLGDADFHSPNLIWLGERSDTARWASSTSRMRCWGTPATTFGIAAAGCADRCPQQLELTLLTRYIKARARGRRRFDPPASPSSTICRRRVTPAARTVRPAEPPRRQAAYLRHQPGSGPISPFGWRTPRCRGFATGTAPRAPAAALIYGLLANCAYICGVEPSCGAGGCVEGGR